MKKKLSLQERLIVALDLKPQYMGGKPVRDTVLQIVDDLAETGVVIKVNAVLDVCGHGLIDDIHDRGLQVFVDKKYGDIPETMGNYGGFLSTRRPELVTVTVGEAPANLQRMRDALGNETSLLGVLVLSSVTNEDVTRSYGPNKDIDQLLYIRGTIARDGSCDGVICPTKELSFLRVRFPSFEYVSPGIRLADDAVAGDDQNPNRVGTPAAAIRAGADRLVVGRPIMNAPNRRDMVSRILSEMDSVL